MGLFNLFHYSHAYSLHSGYVTIALSYTDAISGIDCIEDLFTHKSYLLHLKTYANFSRNVQRPYIPERFVSNKAQMCIVKRNPV